MAETVFGRLQARELRDAWPSEPGDFTPWLAKNLELLGEALGIEMELLGEEVAVDEFWADIHARDIHSDEAILIENQLEPSDHRHLGQILTYLAGLDAKTVIWIAKSFSQAHLSAINWLNSNTSETFSFFAVRLRLVQIGESPLAPVFEIAEQPNDFERKLRRRVRAKSSGLQAQYGAFWDAYLAAHPEATQGGVKPSMQSNLWLPVPGTRLVVGMYLSREGSGIYIRGGFSVPMENAEAELIPYRDSLEAILQTTFGPEKDWFYVTRSELSYQNSDNWPQLIDWLEAKRLSYSDALARSLVS